MTQVLERVVTAVDVKRFLAAKHLTGCTVCGRSSMDCQGCTSAENPRVNGLVSIVCQHCGAVTLHDPVVIGRWLDCHPQTV